MKRWLGLAWVLVIVLSGPTAAGAESTRGPTAGQSPHLLAAAGRTPVRVKIAAIGLNEPVVAVGLDRQDRPIVPRHNVGWYNRSAVPGSGDNVVMWGHVLRWKNAPNIPAPFARLKEVKVGAEVRVLMANGQARRYRVTRQVWVRPHQVEYILPVGSERLTLVSCIGDNVIVNGRLTKQFRLVTIAKPIR